MENFELLMFLTWLIAVAIIFYMKHYFSDKQVLIRDLRKRGLDRQADIIEMI